VSIAFRALLAVAAVACVSLALTSSGSSAPAASRDVAFGVADDAWLAHGPGTLESRLRELSKLGVEVVRFTVRWDQVAPRRPQDARDPSDDAYDWAEIDGVFKGLRRHGIEPVVTLFGTPSWANGGRGPNWAPSSSQSFGSFAYAAGRRYPWIRYWTIWNEPNRPAFLRPTTPKTYVNTLLNPAYAGLHSAIGRVQVGEASPRRVLGMAAAWHPSPGSVGWRRLTRSSTRTLTIPTRGGPGRRRPGARSA